MKLLCPTRRAAQRSYAALATVSLLYSAALFAQNLPGEMVAVPAGAFTMGSAQGPQDERPAHAVTLAPYAIDRYPVTNTQFARFLESRGGDVRSPVRLYDIDDPDARIHRRLGRWSADEGFERHPVVEVPWMGAREYCRWLDTRLPTEAEWEKAARGTDARQYPWGNGLPDARRARYAARLDDTAAVDAHPAGASPYGAHDMAGNAWEWVSSAYLPYPYRADDGREDPATDLARVTRGGGHDSSAAEITTTQRGRDLSRNPAAGHHNIGFRCARSG